MLNGTGLRRLMYTLTGLVLLVPVYIMVSGPGGGGEEAVIARISLNGGEAVLKTQPQATPESHADYGRAKDMTLTWDEPPREPPRLLRLRQQGAPELTDPEAGLLHGSRHRLHAHVPVTGDAPDAPMVLEIQWWDGRREQRTIRTDPLWVTR